METYYLKAPLVDERRLGELSVFEKKIGITFKEKRLLNLAFTHTSYANELTGDVDDYERLEFLGDSILGMVTAEYLFDNLTKLHEGDFSRIKSSVVSEESLSEVALNLDLSRFILIGHGEEISDGRHKKAIMADAMEAVIAAIYLDQGFETARSFVLSFIEGQISHVLDGSNSNKDYKSMLQEYLQKRRQEVPEYLLDHTEGPQHQQRFFVKVFAERKCFGPAEGNNKKSAEQNAAHLALKGLGVILD